MCSYRVRCAAFITLITLVFPTLPSPVTATVIATVPEMITSQSSADSLASHVIAITTGGLADPEVTVPSGTGVVWQNSTDETLQILSGVPGYQIYLPLVLRGSGGSMAAARAAQPPSGLGAPRESATPADWGGTVPPGEAYSHVFDVVGTYPYYVAPHPGWRGRITVVNPPPDPGEVAPPVDPSVATGFFDGTSFLYTGPNPIQTGVAPGTIKAQTVAVLRGRVTDRDGIPLPSVTITVLHHPELGQTLTREDGMFDLAVNGGGLLTLDYAKDGYLPAQRQVDAPWRDYAWAPDVVLIPLDSAVTTVALEAGTMQVARGSAVSDTDGTRQSTLLVPAGTGAHIVLPGGITQTVASLAVRATEYTVGDNGPQAMPAELPPNVGYTYAFELSADEALTVGASEVAFDQPLTYYVENFLGFPVGTVVPTGYYDRDRGLWVASDSGRVVGITAISAGLADLDTDGDGIPDNGAVITPTMVLTITNQERAQLATLYSAGASLWRVPVAHFSAWDSNWSFSPPPDADFPNQPLPEKRSPLDDCPQDGSIIGCDSQTLGEDVEVAGTPFRLHYASDRVQGNKADRTLYIALSGNSLPDSLDHIVLEVDVAGRHFSFTFPPTANQAATFTWDGLDAYGRQVQGRQPVKVGIGYVYEGVYQKTDRFGYNGNGLITVATEGVTPMQAYAPIPMRVPITLWQRWAGGIGGLDFGGMGLGGWALSIHHVYAPEDRTVYHGDGERQSAAGLGTEVISAVAGNGLPCDRYHSPSCGDGGPAAQASITAGSLRAGSDGSLYVAGEIYSWCPSTRWDATLRRIDASGVVTTVAGTKYGCYPTTDPCGDGGPATQATFARLQDIALGADGSVYILDDEAYRVRRVDAHGIITTVVGTGERCASYNDSCGDGGLATEATLWRPANIALGPDGSLYIIDGARLRRVTGDGAISTVAGGFSWCGLEGGCGDGGPALDALFSPGLSGLAVASSGEVYVGDNARVRRIDTSGVITTVAGTGEYCTSSTLPCGDGNPAVEARISFANNIVVGSDGSLYISTHSGDETADTRVRVVAPDGLISTIAGSGEHPPPLESLSGDGGPATAAALRAIYGMDVAPDGALYLIEFPEHRVRQVAPVLPELALGDVVVSAPDGSQVYRFSRQGRHLATLDPLTGGVIYQFAYDTEGRLASVEDADGNTTIIEHDASGNPTGIVGPFGQRTALTVDTNGYLASIVDPAGNATHLTTGSDGLLGTLTDPRGYTHSFAYDSLGRLTSDENPGGGAKTLARIDGQGIYTVTVATSLGLTSTYSTDVLSTRAYRRTVINPAGGQTQTTYGTDGTRETSYPDGMLAGAVYGPDPRWGMQSPVLSGLTVANQNGMVSTIATTRQVSLTNELDPFSLVSQDDQITVNGNTYSRIYDGSSRTIVSTSPEGRRTSAVLDNSGRVVEARLDPSLDPIVYTYDARGLLSNVQQGALSWTYTYDSGGRLVRRVNSDGRERHWGYDAAGRVITTTLPGRELYGFAYDASGNVTQVTMPSGAVHGLGYTPTGDYASYTPPGNPGSFTRTYDADGRLIASTLPGGRTVAETYDGAGRPSGYSYPEAAATFAYAGGDPTEQVTAMHSALAGEGSAQDIAASYEGNLLTSASWSGAAQGSFAYTYDVAYQVTGIHLASGSDAVDLALTRDADGLVTGYGPFALTRDGPGGLVSRMADSAVTVDYGYDSAGRPVAWTQTVNAQQLYGVQATLDAEDRVLEKAETVNGVSHTYAYIYDASAQLVEVRRDGEIVEAYTYDVNGNRTSRQVDGGPVESATYDVQDRLTQRAGVSYQINADGYLEARGGDAFVYSARGELLTASVGTTTVTYAYDALARRVGRTGPEGTTQYLYGNPDNALQVTAVREASGTLSFLYYDDQGHLFALSREANLYYVATDQVGTPRLVSDASGQVVKALEYDSFGVLVSDSNPAFALPIGFAGGLPDAVTGLVHFGYRDYEPLAGRWTSSDPAGFAGGYGNLYAYVGSNPTSFSDPTGLFSIGASAYAGIGVGAKVSVTGKGFSLCLETGFGAGGGIEINPFGEMDRDSETIKAGITAGLGPLKGGVQASLDDCGSFGLKPSICFGPFCTSGEDLKVKVKSNWKDSFKGSTGVSAKVAAVVCRGLRW